jgi:hypothetical protein
MIGDLGFEGVGGGLKEEGGRERRHEGQDGRRMTGMLGRCVDGESQRF